MIKKIKRAQILSAYSSALEEVLQLQMELYDADQLQFLGSEVEKSAYLEMFDARDYPKKTVVKYYKVLSLHDVNLNTYPKALADTTSAMLKQLKIDDMVILTHCKTNLFGDIKNLYPPLKKAYSKLESIAETTDYREGFEIGLKDLPDLMEIFFWMARCDSKAPEYILFFDTHNKLGFFICQYGNLHTIEFEKQVLTPNLITSLAFEEVKSRCYDKFSADGKIAGRK